MEREAKFLDRSFAVLSRWTRALKTPRGSRASDPAGALPFKYVLAIGDVKLVLALQLARAIFCVILAMELAHGVAIGEVMSALAFAHLLAVLGVIALVAGFDRL